jgi:hypothetical protein
MIFKYSQVLSKDLKELSLNFEDPAIFKYRYNGKFYTMIYTSSSCKYYEDGKPYLYFKVYISHKKKKPDFGFKCMLESRVYRISMLSPEYIIAKDDKRKRFLSKKELEEVLALINYPDCWKGLISKTNNNHEIDSTEISPNGIPWKPIPENLPMPDYSQLPTRD